MPITDKRKIIDINHHFRIGNIGQNYYVTRDVTVRNVTGVDGQTRDLTVHASIDKDQELEDVFMSWLARLVEDKKNHADLREILGGQWNRVGRMWLQHLEAIARHESKKRKHKELSMQLTDEINSLKDLRSGELGLDPIIPTPQGQSFLAWNNYQNSVNNWSTQANLRITSLENEISQMQLLVRPKRTKNLQDSIRLGRRVRGWHYSIKHGNTNLAICPVEFAEPNYVPGTWKWSSRATRSNWLQGCLPGVNNRTALQTAVNTNVKRNLASILCARGCTIQNAPQIAM